MMDSGDDYDNNNDDLSCSLNSKSHGILVLSLDVIEPKKLIHLRLLNENKKNKKNFCRTTQLIQTKTTQNSHRQSQIEQRVLI